MTSSSIPLLGLLDTGRHRAIWCLVGILAAAAAVFLPVVGAAVPAAQTVFVVELREDITHNTVYLIRRAMNEAATGKATAVVLDMETNGGRVEATEEIIKLLEHSPAKTYTFVNTKAYSAGAFIAAATDGIYMAPGSVIGAAAPMLMTPGGEIEKTPDMVEKKFTSAYAAKIRAAAQPNGHNAEVFDAMVNKTKGLTIDGKEIIKEGEGPLKAALRSLARPEIESWLLAAAAADRIAEGSLRGDAWVTLEALVARIAGVRLAA